jgi:hypothetical protein
VREDITHLSMPLFPFLASAVEEYMLIPAVSGLYPL